MAGHHNIAAACRHHARDATPTWPSSAAARHAQNRHYATVPRPWPLSTVSNGACRSLTVPADPQDFGQEAIEILLQVMENERDKLVVILAGYKDRMDDFFSSNPGMSSRVAHHIDFAAYEMEELIAISRVMLQETRYYLSGEAEVVFRDYLARRMQQPRFANARSVRNAMERARLRHAHRLATDLERGWTRDDLMRIEPADILADPGFATAAGEPVSRRPS